MQLPQKFNQGDRPTWRAVLASITTNDWRVVYSFRGPSAVDVTADSQAGTFDFTANGTDFRPGRYRWVAKLIHIDQPTRPTEVDFVGDLQNGSNLAVNCSGDYALLAPGDVVQNSNFDGGGTVTVLSVDAVNGQVELSINVQVANPDGFENGSQFTCTPAALPPVADEGTSKIIAEGQVDVLPDISKFAAGFDARTQTERDLEAVDNAIRAIISGGAVAEYQIGNRSMKKMSMESLQTLRSRLLYQIAREKRAQNIAAGLPDPSNVYIRFTR